MQTTLVIVLTFSFGFFAGAAMFGFMLIRSFGKTFSFEDKQRMFHLEE